MDGKFEKLSNLTPEQINQLMQAALKKKGSKPADKMQRNAEEIYPLSKAQERLWFLSGLSEGEPVYNNPVVISMKVDFDLDIDAMRRAIREIANRHEILRTTFHLRDGKIVQHIHPACEVPVSMEDLRMLSNVERQSYMQEKAIAHGSLLFDLEKLPLIQVQFLRMTDSEYVLLITAHHIINDGWTNAMFAVEIPQLYDAYVNNRSYNLPPVSRQYIDYVHSEVEWLKTEDFSKKIQFWKDQLRDIPPSCMNFTDFQQTVKGYTGGKVSAILNEEEKARIHAFCRKMKITPFEFVIMAYATVIYRYSGQTDLVIGTPVANRSDVKFQQTFGPFINTLPIRFHFSTEQSFNDLVRTTSPVIQQALSNQSVPFAVLVEELNPERDVQSNALFQLHFAFQSFPQLQQTSIRFINIDYHVSKFDLNLWVEDDMEKWIISFSYRVDSFKEATVQRILDNLLCCMQLMMETPEVPLSLLPFLKEEEKSILQSEDTLPTAVPNLWLGAFEEACAAYTDNAAVTDGRYTLTYRELNDRAIQLAQGLLQQGIQKGDLTGICLGRSTDMVVAMLALFKIGAAYLPFDSATPEQRLRYIVRDSGIRFVITGNDNKIQYDDVQELKIDEVIASGNITLPQIQLQDSDLAYVIYTSGTTGNPKGVHIGHGSLYNYTRAVWQRMQLSAGDKLANVSSLAADLGNTMIFPALAYGASVLIVPEECLTDAEQLAAFFYKYQPDALKIVPSHLLAILDASPTRAALPNKLLVLGGESCSALLINKVRQLHPSINIFNHYGPTEATIGSLTYKIGELDDNDSIPIGKPLANTRVYLLDTQQQPVPIGALGEIYLGGANLALGYLNNSKADEERFIPDPFKQGEKLYRTGDHGRLADGNIFFLGRKDRQIKIRGHRIELNEVEFVLRNCEGVKQVVVLAPLVTDKDQVLTAVITLTDAKASISNIREAAAKTLKSPLLPDKFIVLDRIPVTANGKIDEAQTRKLASGQQHTMPANTLNPRDEIELKLLELWKSVLQSDDLGIEDNFFEIGGHSLLAIKLLAGVKEVFNIQLPLAILFEHKNIKQLARVIRAGKAPERTSPIVTLQKANTNKQLYLIHPAGGNVMSYYLLARELRNDWNIYGIQSMKAGLSITELASYYLDEIISNINDAPVVFAGWSMGALIAHAMSVEYMKRTGNSCGLVIIDQPAPTKEIADIKKKTGTAERLAVFAEKVSQLVGADIGIYKETVEGLDTHQQSAVFFAKFKEHGIVPDDIREEDFYGFLDLMIHHNEITMEHEPHMFTGSALIVKANDRLQLNTSGQVYHAITEDMGWNYHLPEKIITTVPGNHITVMNTYVKELAKAITDWYAKANTSHKTTFTSIAS